MDHKKYIFALVLLLFSCMGQAQDLGQYSNFSHIVASTSNLSLDSYRPSITQPKQKGLLETTKMSIGTIYKSHHFSDDEFNETHNGIYLSVNQWSVGTYENSAYRDSVFVAYNSNLYQSRSLQVNLVTGVADGYEGWEYAQGGYIGVVGASAQWMNVKAMVTPEVIAFGIELPLN